MNVLSGLAVPVSADRLLRTHLARRVDEALAEGRRRRGAVRNAEDARRHIEFVQQVVRDGVGELPFGKDGGPLNARVVARHERSHYTIENVLFEV